MTVRKITASFARRAESAPVRSLLLTAFCALLLLLIPMLFTMLQQNPYEICERFYGYEIETSFFEVSDGYVIFRSGDTVLAAPDDYFPAEDFEAGDYYEIFDRLALLNGYYRDMLLPIILLLSLLCAVMLISVSGMLAGLMGLGRKMTHSLSFGKRMRLFAACSWLPALPSALIGFFFPVFHLLVFQLILGFLAWRIQKQM